MALTQKTLITGLLCALFLLQACTSHHNSYRYGGTTVSGWQENTVSQNEPVEAQKLFKSAQKKRKERNYNGALADLDKVKRQFANSELAQRALVDQSEILIDMQEAKKAQTLLEKFLVEHSKSPYAERAQYILAMSQLAQGDTHVAEKHLTKMVESLPNNEAKKKVSQKLAQDLEKRGETNSAFKYKIKAYRFNEDAAEKEALQNDIKESIDHNLSFVKIREEYEKSKNLPKDGLQDFLAFKMVRIHLHLGEKDEALNSIKTYLKEFPNGEFVEQAKTLEVELTSLMHVEQKNIGVILPLTGKYAVYGKRVLQAVLMGAQISMDENLGVGEFSNDHLHFIVRDSAGNIDTAKKALRNLVEEHHVIAILGDILIDTALPLAHEADDLGVPMISLSKKEGVVDVSSWIFRLRFTPKKQGVALAVLAMEVMGYKNFGIMYPKHAYGEEVMHGFWDEVERREGQITAVENYNTDQTTFTKEAKKLVGRYNLSARGQYFECRRKARTLSGAYARKKALGSCSDGVSPIVDFDALLLPDDFRSVSFVVPSLEAEDILVTNNKSTLMAYRKTTSGRVKPVRLLGGSLWNSPELERRLGRQIDGAVWVDGFSPNSGKSTVKKFVKGFRSKQKSSPSLLEAHGFDAGRLLDHLLQKNIQSRHDFRREMQQLKAFPGLSGVLHFNAVGDSIGGELFFQMKKGHIEEVENLDDLRPSSS